MFKYLLPGSELHDRLRSTFSGIDGNLVHCMFKSTDDIKTAVSGWTSVSVDMDKTGSILASLSNDETTLIIHSDFGIKAVDCQMMFYRMKALSHVSFDNFNTSECTTMRRMFMGCESLCEVDMHGLSSYSVQDFTEMFSGCLSCSSIDVCGLEVPSHAETCVYSDMFKDCKCLRVISVGSEFSFSNSMSLANPDSSYIKQTNGKWNRLLDGASFNSNSIPSNVKCSYYAIPVNSNMHDNELVTLGSIKSASKQIVQAMSKQLRHLNE